MSVFATIGGYRAHSSDGIAPVCEAVDVPTMRPRRGKRGSDVALAAALEDALQDLAASPCGFWACEGPRKPRWMVTCRKCWATREIAAVKASLDARAALRAKSAGAPS